MRRVLSAILVALLAVALIVTGGLAIYLGGELRVARMQIDDLTAELEAAEQRIAALEQEPGATEPPPDDDSGRGGLGDLGGLSDLFEDLFGGEGPAAMLREFLDQQGGLDGLDGNTALLQCVQPDELGGDPLPSGDLDEQLDAIADRVEAIRGLEFQNLPDPTLLSDAEIAQRAAAEVRTTYGRQQANIDRRIYSALGALPADIDLRGLRTDLVSTQVAGFYDPETGELVVSAAAGDTLTPVEQVTLAHELDHALTDQALGLPVDETEDVADSDGALAALALIEGDATLTMQQFAVSSLSLADQLVLGVDPQALQAREQLASYPHVLVRSLLFPYEQGLAFVCDLYADGGWEAVDAAYASPPATSAQILFPGRYGNPAPRDLRDPPRPGARWTKAHSGTLGAAELKWLFEAPGDAEAAALSDPLARVAAWNGGEVHLWTDGPASAVAVVLRGRQTSGPSLCNSVTAWYRAAFPNAEPVARRAGERLALNGSRQDAIVACGDRIRIGIGPNLATARILTR